MNLIIGIQLEQNWAGSEGGKEVLELFSWNLHISSLSYTKHFQGLSWLDLHLSYIRRPPVEGVAQI